MKKLEQMEENVLYILRTKRCTAVECCTCPAQAALNGGQGCAVSWGYVHGLDGRFLASATKWLMQNSECTDIDGLINGKYKEDWYGNTT